MIKVLNIINSNSVTSIPIRNANYISKYSDIKTNNKVINKKNFFKVNSINKLLNKADIIHTHHTFSALVISIFFVMTYKRRSKKVFVHTLHRNFHSFTLFSRLIYKYFIFPFRHKLIANSETTKRSLEFTVSKYFFENIVVITNGVDLSKTKIKTNKNSDVIKIISIARMVAIKDQKTIIKAAKYIVERGFNIYLNFCGDGVLRPELEKLIKNYGLESYVKFSGMISESEIYNFLSEANFSIISSINEGFGVATVESMSSETLVIATDIDINHEIINDKDILFDVGNYRQLADLIIYYSENTNAYDLKVKRLKSRSKLFDSTIVGKNHARFYAKICN